ncbi:hypothetical protein [Paludisphaera borealis]|uniref:Uncharacterized protein n=1 Tax=Paludisphaera borealis TaxID=1387353 RepID=A0A1U7CZ88_9BACT|nr:hypothetical protein [Paludisphaera borealis]APW64189.1 hypothetical protein BSF38_05781 [Paludisphaera borealis]
MKKTLTLFAGACFLAGSCMIAGCGGEESSVTKETTVKTPGGSEKTTEVKKVETKGDAAK